MAPRVATLFALVLAASVTSAQQTQVEPPWVWSPQAASGTHVPDAAYTDRSPAGFGFGDVHQRVRCNQAIARRRRGQLQACSFLIDAIVAKQQRIV